MGKSSWRHIGLVPALALAVVLAGCGSSRVVIKTVTVTRPAASATGAVGTTQAAGPASPAPATRYKRCDANIRARS
jgi:hypothetical protein